jgi:hypothetical protein
LECGAAAGSRNSSVAKHNNTLFQRFSDENI